MQYAEENNLAGLILLIDLEKAFDSLSWRFIYQVLKYFNFGEGIIKWIKTFYKNAKLAVNQGGNLSPFFNIGRGCRQGDSLPPYIFILCAEILELKKKLQWGKTEFKLLGIVFNVDIDKRIEKNYNDKITKVENLIKL